jgi:hypothetical protein
LVLRSIAAYRDKKVVGVFVRFSCASHPMHPGLPPHGRGDAVGGGAQRTWDI